MFHLSFDTDVTSPLPTPTIQLSQAHESNAVDQGAPHPVAATTPSLKVIGEDATVIASFADSTDTQGQEAQPRSLRGKTETRTPT